MNILHLFSKKIQTRTTHVYIEKGKKTIKMHQNRMKKIRGYGPADINTAYH